MGKNRKHPISNQELELELAALRKKLAVFSIVSLLLGGGGAFGAVTFFVTHPLEAEKIRAETALALADARNKELGERIGEATLDEKEQALMIESFKERIALLESQLEEAKEAGDNRGIQRLRAKLTKTRTQMESQLELLSKNLQKIKGNGVRWFESPDGGLTVRESVQLTQDLSRTVAEIAKVETERAYK